MFQQHNASMLHFLLQKLLEERSPVSLSSPPAKSCPNIAVTCDIVEYLWSPATDTTLQHYQQHQDEQIIACWSFLYNVSSETRSRPQVVFFSVLSLRLPWLTLTHCLCHSASGNDLFLDAFALYRRFHCKIFLALEHCSSNRTPVLQSQFFHFRLLKQVKEKNNLLFKRTNLSKASFLICLRLSAS